MTRTRHDADQQAILDEVAGLAPEAQAEAAVDFARVSLRRLPAEELRSSDPGRIAGRLFSGFVFADAHREGMSAIRVFVPEEPMVDEGEPVTLVEIHTEDRPFLVATVQAELDARGIGVTRTLHPIYGVSRDETGAITSIEPARTAGHRESFLHFELDRALPADDAAQLEQALRRDVADVFRATGDFPEMRRRVETLTGQLRSEARGHVDDDELEEAAALLDWLMDGNLLLLGIREYEIIDLPPDHPEGPGRATQVVTDSGLGILADQQSSRYREPVKLRDIPDAQLQRYLHGPLLTVSRSNRVSSVQRRARMDYIGVKRLGPDGEVAGEFRILGLFTRKAVNEPARTTPVLRRKLRRILELEDVVPGSHDEATIVSLFQALPKDELFQADVDTLHDLLVDLFHAEEHSATRVALRIEEFTRTVSVLVAVPRDRYSPELRRRFTSHLLEVFGGAHVGVDLSLGERNEALARFSVHVGSGEIPSVAVADLEKELLRLTRSWSDDVIAALREAGLADDDATHALIERLPRAYRDVTPVDSALSDLQILRHLEAGGEDLRVAVQRPHQPGGPVRIKAYRHGAALELSNFIPYLEDLGLTVAEELPFSLEEAGPRLHVHDFGVRDDRDSGLDATAQGSRIADAVLAAWRGLCESDGLHRLVISAGVTWRDLVILRAYRRFRRQLGTVYTPEYVNEALASHPAAVAALIAYFGARFDPDLVADEANQERAREAVVAACDRIERLDHDRILRGFLSMIDATLRTNAYRRDAVTDDEAVRYLSLKIDPGQLADAPKPVPHREIFVYSPEVEGVHLRGGPVARGGLRWSDRQDDVRTEILGLMKAQMLKNALIVPTGAKGGFVLKHPPSDPQELRAEVERQYVTFIRGLLDVTDNIVNGEVVPPPEVHRYDGDDAYLVVAADKGTATFSDRANDVARRYGFWLGDAFASGGSQGYDHKILGITARGAWVAVRRHFLELGVDPETEPVTAVGIGDMSGDVFGNGMLRSRTLQLIAAFDHRDIFLDPDPDPERSFEERARLFGVPGSTWQDYDRDAISAGGGVFSRDQKVLSLSPRVQQILRIAEEEVSPPALIRAILTAPVDLLWAGGIGTYVKASHEQHADVGDRANDETRVDAGEVRARIFGEGANLAITQRGRIQYARRGGRIDQDAIHNAGGVDISDHEVNVKILLGLAVDEGRLTSEELPQVLEQVTDDVVAHVLHDVEQQVACLSAELADSPSRMDAYERLLTLLEDQGTLDRQVEALPDTDTMMTRAERDAGLTRPELATLLGYAKRSLTRDVRGSSLPRDPAVAPVITDYFPPLLLERFGDLVPQHRLHDELVSMLVANEVVNRLGITTVFALALETGVARDRVLAAAWAAREVSGAAAAWQGTDRLAALLGPDRQRQLAGEVTRLVVELTRTYLADPSLPDVFAIVERDQDTFTQLQGSLMHSGTADQRSYRLERAQHLMDDLVDPDLATFIACTRDLAMGPSVAAVLRSLGRPADRAPAVADAFLRLAEELSLQRLQRTLDRVEPEGRWAEWQQGGLASDLRRLHRELVSTALSAAPTTSETEAVSALLTRHRASVAHATSLIRELEGEEHPRLDAVAVVLRALRDITRPGAVEGAGG